MFFIGEIVGGYYFWFIVEDKLGVLVRIIDECVWYDIFFVMVI